ncbi:Y+L amino acid transporter 2 [Chionoecetes opilio]|uniref:Y+L amino acid transporter 2 n=1 Tax=Chionoecetes opilio TaxID=41210 RepID=A0A8J4YGN0_CHIOP|nr:Y+L amino acid transporter 2 [Chionoecetes opilio]
MPRAIAISVTCVIVIYTLTNVAYFAVLPKDLMLASPAVAVARPGPRRPACRWGLLSGREGRAALMVRHTPRDVMLGTFGNLTLGVMAWTIPVFVACSISGALNGNTIIYSRLLFVSARRGHLPRLLSLVHIENNTPVTSLMFLPREQDHLGPVWGELAHAHYSQRGRRPGASGLDRFPLIYIAPSFFCAIPEEQPLEVVAALVTLARAFPVYYFLSTENRTPQCLLNARDLELRRSPQHSAPSQSTERREREGPKTAAGSSGRCAKTQRDNLSTPPATTRRSTQGNGVWYTTFPQRLHELGILLLQGSYSDTQVPHDVIVTTPR